jgi:hypothetical protein
MAALDRFEDWLHGMFESGLSGLLGGHLQPVDLARRLADHMDDHRLVGAARTYVPNAYRAYLATVTLVQFAGFHAALEDELAAYLAARADERGHHLVGRVRVKLLADAALKAEHVRIESDLVDTNPQDGDERTRAIEVRPTAAAVDPVALHLSTGRRLLAFTGPGPVTVGRALDNDVILDDGSVSRHHARFVCRGRNWMLEDLESAFGVYVNERRVSACMLRTGDRLRFGVVGARVESDREQAST